MTVNRLDCLAPLCRYPGIKTRTGRFFLPYLDLSNVKAYVEPFAGAGGMTLHIVPRLAKGTMVVLNDLDPGIAALWQSLTGEATLAAVCRRIGAFTPTIGAFTTYAENPIVDDGIETAFRCLVLHQCSYNGFGAQGGPMGGWQQQDGRNRLAGRWKAERLQGNLRRWHQLLRTMAVQVVNCDGIALLDQIPDSESVLVYADPPYVEAGPRFYRLGLDEQAHRRLAARLRSTERLRWAVTYDDHPLVRHMYEGLRIEEVDVHGWRRPRKSRFHHRRLDTRRIDLCMASADNERSRTDGQPSVT